MWWSPNIDAPAAKAVECHRHRYRHVDADHADLHVARERVGDRPALREHGGAVGKLVAVDKLEPADSRRTRTTDSTGPKISSR